jgi:hypothetical protein
MKVERRVGLVSPRASRDCVMRPLLLLSIALPMILLSSCKKQQTEVFPLARLTSIETGTTASGESYRIKNEYFVIAHPPKDRSELKSVIEAYNAKTLSQGEIDKYAATFRVFYRETDFTPRDYAGSDKGYFEHDSIESHARDALAQVKWTKGSANAEYTFYSEDELP